MSSSWVSDNFPQYRLDKGVVLEFLKDTFGDSGRFGDNDFGVKVVLHCDPILRVKVDQQSQLLQDDYTFRVPSKLTSVRTA